MRAVRAARGPGLVGGGVNLGQMAGRATLRAWARAARRAERGAPPTVAEEGGARARATRGAGEREDLAATVSAFLASSLASGGLRLRSVDRVRPRPRGSSWRAGSAGSTSL